MSLVMCAYCGADYHLPWEDGLVECRERLKTQLDDGRFAYEQSVARVAELEAALRGVASLAGEAKVTIATLAAFAPLTDILILASEALPPAPFASTTTEKTK